MKRQTPKPILGQTPKPILAAAALAASVLAAGADYQFVISGHPVANPSVSVPSAGIALSSGAVSARSGASALEARYRTRDESEPTSLRSDAWQGFILVVR